MSEAIEILKSCDAFLEGHFLLSSGRHSSAYCQMAYLQQYPDRCAEAMKAVMWSSSFLSRRGSRLKILPCS